MCTSKVLSRDVPKYAHPCRAGDVLNSVWTRRNYLLSNSVLPCVTSVQKQQYFYPESLKNNLFSGPSCHEEIKMSSSGWAGSKCWAIISISFHQFFFSWVPVWKQMLKYLSQPSAKSLPPCPCTGSAWDQIGSYIILLSRNFIPGFTSIYFSMAESILVPPSHDSFISVGE